MTYQYDSTRHNPPAPVLRVTLRVPSDGSKQVTTDALVDTGADIVCCPSALLNALGAHPAGTCDVSGINGEVVQECEIYFLDFEVAGRRILAEVAAVGNELLLGRNLLNEFSLKLDGHARELSFE